MTPTSSFARIAAALRAAGLILTAIGFALLLPVRALFAQDATGALPISLTGGYAVFWTDPIDFGGRPGSAFFLRGFYRLTPRWQLGFVEQDWGRRLLFSGVTPPPNLQVYRQETGATAYLGAVQLRPQGLDNLALRAGAGIARVEEVDATSANLVPVAVSRVSNPAVLYAGASYDVRLLPRVYLTATADLTRLLHSDAFVPFRTALFAGLGLTLR